MPFYDYQCEKCKETFEVLQKVSDEPLTECEKCKGPLQKVMNSMTFHLYGPGFHSTDNKRKYLKLDSSSTQIFLPHDIYYTKTSFLRQSSAI